MYKHLFLLAIVAVGLNACGPVYVVQQPTPTSAPAPEPAPPPANPDDVSYQTFYDHLSPYGQWIQDPDYGYVWMPEAGPDFKPYATNGHWVYTDEGWAWDSGYPWGWAAFHYGRWFFRDGYGWMWMPGNEWAPAWVSWRNSDDYYGWAPMEPGISVSVAYSSGYNPPPHYWCFVPHQYVASPQVNNYYVRETNNVTIINRTTVINNVTVINNNNHFGNNRYGAGPDPGEVGRFSGRQLRPTPIRDSRAPGGNVSGGGFAVYRPRVNSAPPAGDPHTGGNGRPGGYAPTSFHPLNMARPVNRTSYGANPTPPAGQNTPGAGYDNRGNDNRGNGNDNRGNGNDNRGNGNDNRGNNGNHNGWDNNNGNNGNHNGWNGNNGNNDNRGNNGWNNNGNHNGQPSGAQPVNGQPVNGQPANNPPTYNRPPANVPPANQGHPNNNANDNNGRFSRGGQPAGQPFGVPSAQPAGRPSVPQPAPAIRQVQPQQPQQPQRMFGRPIQNSNQRPATGQPNQNTNQPRPIGNRPKPAPQQHNPPPPQKRDDGQNHR